MSGESKLALAEEPELFERANAFAAAATARLRSLLGPDAEITHVGATAVPNCLTKGDVDIVVRVDRVAFSTALAALDAHYEKNIGSPRDDRFASYTDETGAFPLGIQLVVRGSEYDSFKDFSDRLRASETLRASYNALKRSFVGADMETYRKAKADFIARTLAGTTR